MSDWQAGDLALCVDGPSCGHCCDRGIHPLDGLTLTVAAAFPHWTGAIALNFPCDESDYCACQFRKIRPDEQQACEPEFVTLLKRSTVFA